MEEFKATMYMDTFDGSPKTRQVDVYYAAGMPKRKRDVCVNIPGGQVVLSTKKLVQLLKAQKAI